MVKTVHCPLKFIQLSCHRNGVEAECVVVVSMIDSTLLLRPCVAT